MKSIRLTLLIVLMVIIVLISAHIDQTVSFFSKENLNSLFSLLMCGILSSAVLFLTSKMEGIDKKLYPKNKSFVWLFICFGFMCLFLIAIAFSKEYDTTVLYIVFFGYASTSTVIVLNIRNQIRKNTLTNEN